MDIRPNPESSPTAISSSPGQTSESQQHQPMHVCLDCGKSYRAKETLNRHRKNHSRSIEHVCNVCNVGFRRKDLLLRHSKIHQGDGSATGHPRDRQRIRQACDRCSKLKTKCDAQSPACSTCIRGNHDCTYTGRATVRARRQSDLTNETHTNQINQLSQIIESMPMVNIPSSQPLALGSEISMDLPLDTPNYNSHWPADAGSENMAWPWLYETLFLQEDSGPMSAYPNIPSIGDNSSPGALSWDSNQLPANTLPPAQWHIPSPGNQTVSMNIPEIGSRRQPHIPPNFVPEAVLSDTRLPSIGGGNMTQLPPFPEQRPTSTLSQPGNVASNYNNQIFLTRTSENQRAVVEELVQFSFDFSKPNPDSATCSNFWRKMSTKVEKAFDLHHVCPNRSGGHPLLYHFLDLFFDRFHHLWPVFRKQSFVYERAPPHIFMTLVSIGSMYGGTSSAIFGFLAHETIRLKLVVVPFKYHLPEETIEPLCQSMLLVQIAALYFGHKQAFSIAQQMGSIVVSQARKINLFNDGLASHLDQQTGQLERLDDRNNGKPLKPDDIVNRWIRAESRKRLAFGILRAEVFVSMLLNTRPLVSFEEVNIEMPCSNAVWRLSNTELHQHVLNTYRMEEESKGYLYSDLVRIALDKGEALPSLGPSEFELLLFGIQQLVWRFSHDLALMPRLTGRHKPTSPPDPQNDLFGSWSFSAQHVDRPEDVFGWASDTKYGNDDHQDLLDCSFRQMNDLKADYMRSTHVLRKWKQSFAIASTANEVLDARGSILASRLLYHLSFIRLRADIQTFHLLALRLIKGEPHQTSVHSIYRWSITRDAKVALEHACAIWSLISRESERDEQQRAKFTIASHVSLYHAASVVWAYAGTHETPSGASLDMGETFGNTSNEGFRIHRANNSGLMSNFAALLKKITPAWISTSSFSKATSVMARNPLPLPLPVEKQL